MGMDGMEAYLIESRSMKGLSGSPVFVHLGVVRPSGNKDTAYQRVGGIFYLLGLVVAHWQQKIADPDAIVIDEISGKTVNVGLAVVAPATKIIEVINHPDLKASREEAEKEFVERMRATSDALT
jgi:hypothetical protein